MTIKEVSQKYNISQDTLRYYERIGMIPKVARTASGIRNYQESDLNWVELVICMRSAGLPVEALIEYVEHAINQGVPDFQCASRTAAGTETQFRRTTETITSCNK